MSSDDDTDMLRLPDSGPKEIERAQSHAAIFTRSDGTRVVVPLLFKADGSCMLRSSALLPNGLGAHMIRRSQPDEHYVPTPVSPGSVSLQKQRSHDSDEDDEARLFTEIKHDELEAITAEGLVRIPAEYRDQLSSFSAPDSISLLELMDWETRICFEGGRSRVVDITFELPLPNPARAVTGWSQPSIVESHELPFERDEVHFKFYEKLGPRDVRAPRKLVFPPPPSLRVPETTTGSDEFAKLPILSFPSKLMSSMVSSTSSPDLTFETMSWVNHVAWDKNTSSSESSLVLNENDVQLVFQEEGEEEDYLFQKDGNDDISGRYNISFDGSTMYDVEPDRAIGRRNIQHAAFARELEPPTYQSILGSDQLTSFHRPKIQLSTGSLKIFSKSKERSRKSSIAGTTLKFVPRKEKEVSARDGDLVLLEYVEQNPIVMMNMGMASELILYYRQRSPEDSFSPGFEHGRVQVLPYEEDAETFFMGKVPRGSCVHSLTCNMLTAPIFPHEPQDSYFLLSKPLNKTSWYVRDLPPTFVAGQVHTKIEVPSPQSRAHMDHVRDRLNVEILRSLIIHQVVQVSDILEVFPTQSETSVRARLSEFAVYQRGGTYSGSWRPKKKKNMPSLTEIEKMVSPEDVCAFHQMQVGKVALESQGVGFLSSHNALSTFLSRSEEDYEIGTYIEEVLELTPWNLTSNFLKAWKRQLLLDLSGPGNPMGHGEGFSFIQAARQEHDPDIPRIVEPRSLTGTSKDLRKLTMVELRDALRKFHVPEETIKTLGRWPMVQLVREQSSSGMREGHDTGYDRFARPDRLTFKALRSKFMIDAQKIFDRHCEVLASSGVPDFSQCYDEENEEQLSDADDLTGDVQQHGKVPQNNEAEQKEVQEFLKERSERQQNEDEPISETSKKKRTETVRMIRKRVLTFHDDGRREEVMELIDDPDLVAAFDSSKQDGGDDFQKLLHSDASQKSDLIARRKSHSMLESNRSISQIRRKKKKPRRGDDGMKLPRPTRNRKTGKPCSLRCSACGNIGHMSTNKRCPVKIAQANGQPIPMFQQPQPTPVAASTPILPGESPSILRIPSIVVSGFSATTPVKKEGSAVKLDTGGKIVFKYSGGGSDNESEVTSTPKRGKKRKKTRDSDEFVAPETPVKLTVRSRGDPKIRLNDVFNAVLQSIGQRPNSFAFKAKITNSIAPNYSKIIANPMYLDRIKQQCDATLYQTSEQFLDDLRLIVSNCELYNGPQAAISGLARELLSSAEEACEPHKELLADLEQELQLYSRNEQFKTLMMPILIKLGKNRISTAFRVPVNTTLFKNYLAKVRTPMSLSRIREKLESNLYSNLDDIATDFSLLWRNSLAYNGPLSPYTKTGRELLDLAIAEMQAVFPEFSFNPDNDSETAQQPEPLEQQELQQQ